MNAQRSCFASLAALLLLLSLAQSVTAQSKPAEKRAPSGSVSLAVRVVDVADDRAYIEPGSSAGLRVGDEVRLAGEHFRIAASSSSFAVVPLAGKHVPLGASGAVSMAANRPDVVDLSPEAPTPLSRFRDEWRRARVPASKQTPTPVPLGMQPQQSSSRVVLSDSIYGVLPEGGQGKFVGNEVRGRLHYEPYSELPFAFDLDLGAQTFSGDDFGSRPGAAARQIVRLRELSLTYGTAASFRGALGRLRAASSWVGQVDGLRLEAPLTSELRLSAFGGAVPQAFTGMFSTKVARFGAELLYQDAQSSFLPRLVAGGYASVFAGTLDEKKAYAALDLLPRHARIGGHGEVSFFDPGNPWHAKSAELTSAAIDGDVELGVFHFGARAELHRPDRSRWLASLLPPEWLCWSSPADPLGTCLSSNATYLWLVDSGARIGKFSVDLGGQSTLTTGTDATNFGGFANLRWLDLVGKVHLDTGASAFAGSVVRSTAATISPGFSFSDGKGDLSLRYRGALVRYRAALRSSLEHVIGAGLWLAPYDALDIDLEGDWMQAKGDVTALVVQGVLAWHLGL